jgi:hypothetical protein
MGDKSKGVAKHTIARQKKKKKLVKLWGPATSGKINCRVYFAIKGGVTIQPQKRTFRVVL